MEIRIRETGQIMFEDEFRRHLMQNNGPTYEVLSAEIAEQLGVDVVFEGPQPTVGRYQMAYRDGAEQQSDGKWYTKYAVVDLDDDAKALKDASQAEAVRITRNQMLKDSDFSQLVDSPVDKQAWADYRQALRDITQQLGFPFNVTWPDAP